MEDMTHPFIAVLVYQTLGLPEPSYREDVVLLWAEDEETARGLARRRGENQSFDYIGVGSQRLRQQLVGVIDVRASTDDELDRDADLYSRYFTDYAAYSALDTMTR